MTSAKITDTDTYTARVSASHCIHTNAMLKPSTPAREVKCMGLKSLTSKLTTPESETYIMASISSDVSGHSLSLAFSPAARSTIPPTPCTRNPNNGLLLRMMPDTQCI